jgi:hypothetical protein
MWQKTGVRVAVDVLGFYSVLGEDMDLDPQMEFRRKGRLFEHLDEGVAHCQMGRLRARRVLNMAKGEQKAKLGAFFQLGS